MPAGAPRLYHINAKSAMGVHEKTWFLGAVANEKPRSAACTANTGRATLPVSGGKCPRGLPAYIILSQKVQWEKIQKYRCLTETHGFRSTDFRHTLQKRILFLVHVYKSNFSLGHFPRGIVSFTESADFPLRTPVRFLLVLPRNCSSEEGGMHCNCTIQLKELKVRAFSSLRNRCVSRHRTCSAGNLPGCRSFCPPDPGGDSAADLRYGSRRQCPCCFGTAAGNTGEPQCAKQRSLIRF